MTDRYQKCPVCDGTGLVSKPPWVAGDQYTWTATSSGPWSCNRCNGSGTLDQISLIETVKERIADPQIVDVDLDDISCPHFRTFETPYGLACYDCDWTQNG